MKLVVLNDLHPDSSPGAASIAFLLAKRASTEFETEFWFSRGEHRTATSSASLTILKRRSRFGSHSVGKNRLLFKIWEEFFNPNSFFWFSRQLIARKASHIWVHQIGSEFPYSVILLCKLLNVKVVITLHDFGLISSGKLYPSDFYSNHDGVDEFLKSEGEFFPTYNALNVGHMIKIIRRLILIKIVNLSDKIICISEMQARILRLHGLRVSAVIGNGVNICSCELNRLESNSQFEVLFAGRAIGKGLGQIIESVNRHPGAHLHLAGGVELSDIAEKSMPENKYTFHGMLTPEQLVNLIHSVDLVSVLSECYDVYPTITLESLMHKVPVVTSRTAGNFGLVVQLAPDLLIPYRQIPDLNQIQKLLSAQLLRFPKIDSVEDSWTKYRSFLIS